MVKLVFYVHCKSWKNGGYENTHYFQTENKPEVGQRQRAWKSEALRQ